MADAHTLHLVADPEITDIPAVIKLHIYEPSPAYPLPPAIFATAAQDVSDRVLTWIMPFMQIISNSILMYQISYELTGFLYERFMEFYLSHSDPNDPYLLPVACQQSEEGWR